ncbi:unnamed protein product, partial [Prorocentrum cordatum]
QTVEKQSVQIFSEETQPDALPPPTFEELGLSPSPESQAAAAPSASAEATGAPVETPAGAPAADVFTDMLASELERMNVSQTQQAAAQSIQMVDLDSQLIELFKQMQGQAGWGEAEEDEAGWGGGVKEADPVLEACKAGGWYVKAKTPIYRRFRLWLKNHQSEKEECDLMKGHEAEQYRARWAKKRYDEYNETRAEMQETRQSKRK